MRCPPRRCYAKHWAKGPLCFGDESQAGGSAAVTLPRDWEAPVVWEQPTPGCRSQNIPARTVAASVSVSMSLHIKMVQQKPTSKAAQRTLTFQQRPGILPRSPRGLQSSLRSLLPVGLFVLLGCSAAPVLKTPPFPTFLSQDAQGQRGRRVTPTAHAAAHPEEGAGEGKGSLLARPMMELDSERCTGLSLLLPPKYLVLILQACTAFHRCLEQIAAGSG